MSHNKTFCKSSIGAKGGLANGSCGWKGSEKKVQRWNREGAT